MSSKKPPKHGTSEKEVPKGTAPTGDAAQPMNAKQKAIWATIAVVAIAGTAAAMYRSAHKKARIPANGIALAYESVCVREDKTGTVRCRRPGLVEFQVVPELKGADDIAIGAGGIVCGRFGKEVSCFDPQKIEPAARIVREKWMKDSAKMGAGMKFYSVTADGKVVVWDDPGAAQALEFPKDMVRACVGPDFVCAVGKDKKAHCFGGWPFCTLNRASCDLGENVKDVACGAMHACVLHENGTVSCIGKNLMGQLGRGTVTTDEPLGLVTGVADVVEVSAGIQHTCVRHANRTLSCFGDAWGRRKPTPLPEPLQGVFGVTSLVSWGADSCAIADGGYVSCWGLSGGLAGKSGPLTVPTPVFLAKE